MCPHWWHHEGEPEYNDDEEEERGSTYRATVMDDLLLHHERGASGKAALGHVLTDDHEVGVAMLLELTETALELALADVPHFSELAQHIADALRGLWWGGGGWGEHLKRGHA